MIWKKLPKIIKLLLWSNEINIVDTRTSAKKVVLPVSDPADYRWGEAVSSFNALGYSSSSQVFGLIGEKIGQAAGGGFRRTQISSEGRLLTLKNLYGSSAKYEVYIKCVDANPSSEAVVYENGDYGLSEDEIGFIESLVLSKGQTGQIEISLFGSYKNSEPPDPNDNEAFAQAYKVNNIYYIIKHNIIGGFEYV